MVNEAIGDNKEFGIPNVSDGDVTVYFYNNAGNTSANDTATAKYFDTSRGRSAFAVRTDKVLHIVSINGVTFTDPITIPVNGSYTERELADIRFMALVNEMVIRATQDNTNVKIRTRGGV